MDQIDYAQADQEQLAKFLEAHPEEPTVEEKLDELLSILRPLAPVLAALPELMEKVDPLLEGLRTSPVLKMMGVKF